MSLKSLSKTRWSLEPQRVVIYPYGVFYIFTLVFALFATGLFLVYVTYQNTTFAESLPFVLFLLLIVAIFWGHAGTYVEFDHSKGHMRKMFLGFIPATTTPLSKLQGINVVSNMAGSYNYRLFRKDSRYGKGLVVSCGYTKSNDPNALAFVEEAVPLIHQFLDQYDTPADYVKVPLTSYRFFTQEGPVFTVKNAKAGAIVIGLFFIAIGISMLALQTNGLLAKVVIIAIMLGIGFIFFNAAYTETTFNTDTQLLERRGWIKAFNKRYHFGAFAGLQTVRQSFNFVYTGTSINMYFLVPGKADRQDVFAIASFRKSAQVERFVDELHQIMEG